MLKNGKYSTLWNIFSATYFLHEMNYFHTFDNMVKKFFIDVAAKINSTLESNTNREFICCDVNISHIITYNNRVLEIFWQD